MQTKLYLKELSTKLIKHAFRALSLVSKGPKPLQELVTFTPMIQSESELEMMAQDKPILTFSSTEFDKN